MRERKIPAQQGGASSKTRHTVKLKNKVQAQKLFQHAKRNLLNVNSWHLFAGKGSAKFTVIDNRGNETHKNPVVGNYFRIDLPVVPGSAVGQGYDWVMVEKIEEHQLPYPYVFIQVRPAIPPFSKGNEIAHFFTWEATSTFSIELKGDKVIGEVNGRNEKPNTKVRPIINKIRNMMIALFAMVGFNKPQWKSLVKGLLKQT